jgi:hypothetical protein
MKREHAKQIEQRKRERAEREQTNRNRDKRPVWERDQFVR